MSEKMLDKNYVKTIQADIVDITTFSTFFSKKKLHEIERANLLSDMKKNIDESDILIIKGDSGSGKTVLLSQFCQKYNAISIFISPTKPVSFTQEIVIADLIRQIQFLLDKSVLSELPETMQKLSIMYNKKITQLSYHAIKNEPVYIVVDGLYHLIEENIMFMNHLFELMPFGKKNIKFIFSDLFNETIFSQQIDKIRYKKREQTIPGLTSNEIKEIFNTDEIAVTDTEAEEIRATFNGNPMEVSELRYLMERENNDIYTTVDNIQKNSFDYILSKLSEESNSFKILPLIVYSGKDILTTELAQIIELDFKELEKAIENNYFLEVDNNVVKLRNEAYLVRLVIELSSYKKDTYEKLAKFIVKKNDTNDYWLLAQYYEKSENFTELFLLLDDMEFVNSVINSKSLSSLRMLVNSGLKASTKLNDIENILKYSLTNSIVKNRNNFDKKIEIESLMLIGQEDRALSMARASTILEDKIHLLAIIARKQKDDRGVPNPQIVEEIKRLYEKIDFDYLGTSAIEIASELISIDIDLSVTLLEKSFNLEKDESSMDKIMLILSFESFKNPERRNDDLIESIKQKMQSPELKDGFSTMFNFGKSIRPKYLIEEIKKINSINARINFLANWCEENNAEETRMEILRYAFEILNESSEYKSNTGIYYKLSNQVLFDDIENAKEMLELFNSREEILRRNGSTVLYVRLMLNLILLMDKIDKNETIKKIEELYYFVEEIEDISPKLESKSYFLNTLKKLNGIDYYEKKLDIVYVIQIELEDEITKIVDNFAYQEELLSKSLEVLSSTDYDFCCDSVEKVNTIVNREQLYKSIIRGLTNQSIVQLKNGEIHEEVLSNILNITRKIEYDLDIKDNGIEELLEALDFVSDNDEVVVRINRSIYYQIFQIIKEIRDSPQKAKCYAIMLNVFKGAEYLNTEEIGNKILITLQSINILPLRNSTGYELIKIIAGNHLDLANRISSSILDDRNNNEHFEIDEFWTVVRTLKILINSFENVNYEDNTQYTQQIDKILILIDSIESEGERASLYSQLYLAINDIVTQPVREKVLSKITQSIDKIPSEDLRYKSNVIRRCAPSVYKDSRSYFESNIKILSPMELDECYNDLTIFYLTKTTISEPFYFGSSAKYECGYEDMLEALSLIKKCQRDSVKFRLLRILLEIIRDKKSIPLSGERLLDLKNLIEKIISESFCSDDFIKHEGYKILSEYYWSLTFNGFSMDKINTFLDKIEKIPNDSDKALCFTTVASGFKNNKYSDKRDEILDKTEEIIEKLDSISEKILRYEDMAESIQGKNNTKEKKYIKKAFELIDDIDNEDKDIGKRLIDLAHQLDPEFANSLISSYKNDDEKESNYNYKKYTKDLKNIQFNDRLRNDKGTEDLSNLEYNQALEVCKICWESYSYLKSKSSRSKKPDQMLSYLKIASKLPIEESYPIYCWFIENVRQKKSVKEKNGYYDSIYVAARFALINKEFQGATLSEIQDFHRNESDSLSVNEGMRKQAIDFICSKLNKTNPYHITICDPYFDKEDLSFINEVYENLDIDDLNFKILTSDSQLKQTILDGDYGAAFKDYWKDRVSTDSPPFIDVYVINDRKTNQSPFHDRYIITPDHGLSLGGSINGLGNKKEININEISEEIRAQREEYYSHYFTHDTRYFRKNGLDININSFSL